MSDIMAIRDELTEARKDIAQLWTAVREHQMDYWGPDKTNGRRSEIRDVQGDVDKVKAALVDLESRLRHYIDVGRRETCLGLAALEDYKAVCGELYDETVDEGANVKVAQIQAGASKSASRWQQGAIVLVAALVLIGNIVTTAQNNSTQRELRQLATSVTARDAASK